MDFVQYRVSTIENEDEAKTNHFASNRSLPFYRGHSQKTSVEKGREGASQILMKGGEVAWIWY